MGTAFRGEPSPLIGRRAEIRRVLDIIEPQDGESRMLLLLGDAGTGKTSLVAAAADHARRVGVVVLTCQGSEAESGQSFASLHQLLLPVLSEVGMLAEHLRAELESAVGIAPVSEQRDPALLRLAVLTLLTGVSRQRPVLLILDDVQHYDRDSLDVLGFVMRRIAAEDVSVLLAARGQTPPAGVAADLPTLLLGPLTKQAAAELVDKQPRLPGGRARIDVLEQAEGNPLAIIELCRAAGMGTMGTFPNSGLSQTERIQQMYSARLRGLPEESRRLVLYAATASEYEDLATIMTAAGVRSDLAAWAPAEDAGLVTVVDRRVAFRHPLARAGSYHGAPAYLRQQAHRDLAEALTSDPARRAWHLAAACLGQDESVATALEDSAEFAKRRGGFFAAARALERSAECSPEPADQARRYTMALKAALNAGDPSWLRELYGKVLALTRDPELLSVAASGAGLALSLLGHQREAFQVLMSVLESDEPRDGMTVIALAGLLHPAAFQSGLPEMRPRIAALLEAADAGGGDTPYPELRTTGLPEVLRATVLTGMDPSIAPVMMRDIVVRPSPSEPRDDITEMTRLLGFAAIAWYADESDQCVEFYRQSFSMLAAYNSMGAGAQALPAMCAALIDTGRWAEADERLEETATLAAVHNLRHLEIDVEAMRTTLRALRGQRVGMPADPAWMAVRLEENRATHVRLLSASGTAAAGAGDFESAFRHLRLLFDENGDPLHYFLSPRAIVDLAAVAQRIGRQEEAELVLAAVRAALGPRPTMRMILLLHHAEALIGAQKDAEHHFRLATVNPAGEQWPLARARARFHYGQWLRRRRRPLDARPLLTTALETLTRLGADGLAEEARVELRASGVATSSAPSTSAPSTSASSATADALAELTAQQHQIVRLAAQGLRNREIAEQLMLSPRTVSSHLYNVYPKLGVSSRNQLRQVLEGL